MPYRPNLDYFLAIAAHMNITKAAQELHISQQSLSIYLKRLEDFYHVPLFYRRPKLALTPEGQLLKETAEQIELLYVGLDDRLNRSHAKQRKLHLGYSSHVSGQLLDFIASIMSRFHELYPDLKIQTAIEPSSTLESMLLAGQLDFYITHHYKSSPSLQTVSLMRGPMYAAVSACTIEKFFPDSSATCIASWRHGIELKEFSLIPWIAFPSPSKGRKQMDHYAASIHFSWSIISENSNMEFNMKLCLSGIGFTLTDFSFVKNYESHKQVWFFPVSAPSLGLPVLAVRRSSEPCFSDQYKEDLWNTMISMGE